MSNLVAVVDALKNIKKSDVARKVVELFHKNMSYLTEFEQVSFCYSLLGQYNDAIKIMENALPLSPNPQASYHYRNILADLYIKTKKYNRALIYIKINETMQKTKELAYLRLQAEQLLEDEKEKMEGVSPTGFWSKNLADKYHQHSHELGSWISEYFEADTQVHDFGCGWGKYLKDLELKGFKKLQGYEGVVPNNKFFDNIVVQNLTENFEVSQKGNVICLEVGEHIPKEYTDVFLNNISNACDNKLVMSWAVRGQGGTGHVNCLDNHEAIAIIENKGFEYLPVETKSARDSIGQHCGWFVESLLVFERK